mmetsp:Transcript_24681/g.57476  ORF Transcript_24681/g.57476 Transcript_24681/m.57476 type:complete len:255 (-) Transcript_24681:276-1040(-)
MPGSLLHFLNTPGGVTSILQCEAAVSALSFSECARSASRCAFCFASLRCARLWSRCSCSTPRDTTVRGLAAAASASSCVRCICRFFSSCCSFAAFCSLSVSSVCSCTATCSSAPSRMVERISLRSRLTSDRLAERSAVRSIRWRLRFSCASSSQFARIVGESTISVRGCALLTSACSLRLLRTSRTLAARCLLTVAWRSASDRSVTLRRSSRSVFASAASNTTACSRFFRRSARSRLLRTRSCFARCAVCSLTR